MELRRTHMVKLDCGSWQRVSDELIDLERATGGVEFGMGAPREFPCKVHGMVEAVLELSFWEWHVFCIACGYNAWHGMDAEKARADYERHGNLTGHTTAGGLRVGWDTFTGAVDDETSQGSLFVSDKVAERRRDAKEKKQEAVKRHAVKRSRETRASKQSSTVSDWKPSGTTPRVTFADLMAKARKNDR